MQRRIEGMKRFKSYLAAADRKQSAPVTNPELEKKIEAMIARVKEQSERRIKEQSMMRLQEKEHAEHRAGFVLKESSALRKMTMRLPDTTFFKGDPANSMVRKISSIKKEIEDLLAQNIDKEQKNLLREELKKWETISQRAEERIKRQKEQGPLARVNAFRNSFNEGAKSLQQTIDECNSRRRKLAMLRLELDNGSEEKKEVEAEFEALNKFAEELGAMKKENEMARLERLARVQRGFEESQAAKINSLTREVEKGKISLKEALNKAKEARGYLLEEIGESKGPRRNIYVQGARKWAEIMREFEEKLGERRKGS